MDDTFAPLAPKVVLGIAAHPDDLDVGAGGTLAQFAQQGAEIHYLILTNGNKGSDDPDITSTKLVEIRKSEQQAALEITGGASVTFLDYNDGELESTQELKKHIVRAIRTYKPDVVITMDPSVIYVANKGIINHPDHRAAGQATLDAVFPLARDRLVFPELADEGLTPHKTPTILLVNFNEGNYSVDITNTISTKIQGILAHSSQFDGENSIGWVTSMAKEHGALYGQALGERFVRIDIQ